MKKIVLILVVLVLPALAHGEHYFGDDFDALAGAFCEEHSSNSGCIPPIVDTDGDGIADDVDECPSDPTNTCNDPVEPTIGVVQCPEDVSYNTSAWNWYLCNLDIADDPYYSPYGIDFPMSYMTPRDANFTTGSSRLAVYMHPSQHTGTFVNGPSSFRFAQDQVELHVQEEHYQSNPVESWWGFSGNTAGAVANYNGRRIAASIDFILDRHGDKIDLGKGIELMGKSLGGAGAMHQVMILPKYQDKIAVVNAIIGHMIGPKNNQSSLDEWGESHWDEADIRLQWSKVQDVHFSWRGGENDTFNTFDPEFMAICEQRKISCSVAWLQSNHGISESGYSLNMSMYTHPDQNATLDVILPVITNNTSNYHGELRGYHNRGVVWNHSAIIDSATEIQIPLQYIAEKNIGPDLPDQPDSATFSVTPRHVKNYNLSGSNIWTFGSQSGTATVGADGLLTIDGLTLNDGEGYTVLTIKKQ